MVRITGVKSLAGEVEAGPENSPRNGRLTVPVSGRRVSDLSTEAPRYAPALARARTFNDLAKDQWTSIGMNE
jgi:hypothetical protein